MSISKIKIAWKWIVGGVGDVVDYLLDILNSSLDGIDPKNKKSVRAVLNTSLKISGVLESMTWLVPVKWQIAYQRTLDAVSVVCICLEDFNVTSEELDCMKANYCTAVSAWKSPDDGTCVTIDDVMVED